jgi:hypothetical protein
MKTSIKTLHWVPRIIGMLAIMFITVFAADSFSDEKTFTKQISDFLMHMIPSLVLLGILIISWRWELVGGILFTVVGIGLSPFIFQRNYHHNHSVGVSLGIIMTVTFPFIIAGILFIASYFVKKKAP